MNIILEGIAIGWLAYWLLSSDASPKVWGKWQYWWSTHTPNAWRGKPFSCDLCMSWWLSATVELFLLAIWAWTQILYVRGCVNCEFTFFQMLLQMTTMLTSLFARAAIGLLVTRVLGRLDMVIISQKR